MFDAGVWRQQPNELAAIHVAPEQRANVRADLWTDDLVGGDQLQQVSHVGGCGLVQPGAGRAASVAEQVHEVRSAQAETAQRVVHRLRMDRIDDLIGRAVVRDGDHGAHFGAQALGPRERACRDLPLELDQDRQLHHARRREGLVGVEVDLLAADQVGRGHADVDVRPTDARRLRRDALLKRADGWRRSWCGSRCRFGWRRRAGGLGFGVAAGGSLQGRRRCWEPQNLADAELVGVRQAVQLDQTVEGGTVCLRYLPQRVARFDRVARSVSLIRGGWRRPVERQRLASDDQVGVLDGVQRHQFIERNARVDGDRRKGIARLDEVAGHRFTR